MVNTNMPMKKFRITKSFRESGYAAQTVMTRLMSVPTTVYRMVFP